MLLFLDSFDHYATSDILEKWTQYYVVDASPSLQNFPAIGAYGRRGTNGIRWTIPASGTGADGYTNSVAIVPNNNNDPLAIVGFAFTYVGSLGLIGNGSLLYPSSHDVTGGSVVSVLVYVRQTTVTQTAVIVNRNGTLSVVRGEANPQPALTETYTILGTTVRALQEGVTNYIEYKTLIDSTVGTAEIRVNCEVWLTLTNQDTVHTGDGPPLAEWDEIVVTKFQCDTALTLSMDDLYIANGDASDPVNTTVDYLGDVEINYRRPTADVVTDWTPLTGTANYAMVDEIPPDDDLSYNATIAPGDVDTFTMEAASLVGQNVVAVQAIYSRRRPDAGPSTTAPVWRLGGTNYLRPASGDPSTYGFHWGIWTVNPDTLGVITDGAFNASSLGYKKVT